MHRNRISLFLFILIPIIIGIGVFIVFYLLPKQEKPLKLLLNDHWLFNRVGKNEWMPAVVPGCVHTDLLANKKIEDPFYGTNEKNLQWIDKEEWEYKTTFVVDKDMLRHERIELLFEGLDTYGDVYVNDHLIISSDNMFREWRKECKQFLKEGDNHLYIKFFSPIRLGLDKRTENGYELPAINDNSEMGGMEDKKVSVFTRKAPYHYGWDWGPRFVTSGIWRGVFLHAWNGYCIRDFSIELKKLDTTESHSNAWLKGKFEIESTYDGEVGLNLIINDILKIEKRVILKKGLNEVELPFNIDNPKLWWAVGMGESYRYKIDAIVSGDGIEDRTSLNYGIRTIRLIRNKDEKGETFYFELNGKKLFAKGANYIPSDVFLNRVTAEKYEKLIKLAVDGNFNMLRVWGGGVYEDSYFYDLCDKYGILVWQDFMFACSLYPGDDKFIQNVEKEAIDNVKRLRNHPCLALWCGNNEIYTAWYEWGYKEWYEKKDNKLAEKIWGDYDKLFHDILYKVVKTYNNEVPYWPSSPMAEWEYGRKPGEDGVAKNNRNSGDRHYWGVWHGEERFENYNNCIPRFMSEYGFQSFPSFKTIESYTREEDRDIDSDVMKGHQRHPRGNKLIRTYMSRDYNVPKKFDEFIYLSQVLQGEGIRQAIEAHRRNMPYCMGSLYWQFNDCWPVASWSGLDYFLTPKALHYVVKRSFAAILISITNENEVLKIHVVNDKNQEINGKLKLELMDFNGNKMFEINMPVTIGAFSSRVYYEIGVKKLFENRKKNIKSNCLMVAQLFSMGDDLMGENYFYFVSPKYMKLPKAQMVMGIIPVDEGYSICINSEDLIKNLYLYTDDELGSFSENYMDILPGRPKNILFRTTKRVENLEKKIKYLRVN